ADGDIKALKGKGGILGGDYIAGGSIYALELGSDGEVVTSVTVGLNMSVEKRKTKIEQAKKILRPRLNEYLKSVNTLTEMKKSKSIYFTDDNARALARMNKILPQLMDKDSILSQKEKALEKDLQKGAKQCVYVFGTLFPGVKVTIANASRVINSMEESVVLEYREKQQKINIRPMSDEEKKMTV
ncbi:MAG: FapA family protein, partial [Desulfobia sp.]